MIWRSHALSAPENCIYVIFINYFWKLLYYQNSDFLLKNVYLLFSWGGEFSWCIFSLQWMSECSINGHNLGLVWEWINDWVNEATLPKYRLLFWYLFQLPVDTTSVALTLTLSNPYRFICQYKILIKWGLSLVYVLVLGTIPNHRYLDHGSK